MPSFSPVSFAPVAFIPSQFTDGMPARGFSIAARRRVFDEVSRRGRAFDPGDRFRVFEVNEMAGCCVDGGSICLAVGETEWLFFNFEQRLGSRTIVDIESIEVDPATGLTAEDESIVDEETVVDDDTTLGVDQAVKLKLTAATAGTYGVVCAAVLSDGATLKIRGWVTVEDLD